MSPCREEMLRGTSLTFIQIFSMHQAVVPAVPDLQPGEESYVLLAEGVVPRGSAVCRQVSSVKPHFSLGTHFAQGWLCSRVAGGLCWQTCICLRSLRRPDLHLMQISRRHLFMPTKELNQYQQGFGFFSLGNSVLCLIPTQSLFLWLQGSGELPVSTTVL